MNSLFELGFRVCEARLRWHTSTFPGVHKCWMASESLFFFCSLITILAYPTSSLIVWNLCFFCVFFVVLWVILFHYGGYISKVRDVQLTAIFLHFSQRDCVHCNVPKTLSCDLLMVTCQGSTNLMQAYCDIISDFSWTFQIASIIFFCSNIISATWRSCWLFFFLVCKLLALLS